MVLTTRCGGVGLTKHGWWYDWCLLQRTLTYRAVRDRPLAVRPKPHPQQMMVSARRAYGVRKIGNLDTNLRSEDSQSIAYYS